jgi:Ca-activated chloride channel family protein
MAMTMVAATATPTGAGPCADRAALLILDASYSMLGLVGTSDQNRFDLARAAVASFVDRYPPYGYLALRLYGSESHALRNNCQDTILVVPFAPARENHAAIKLALATAHARGVTPIAYALEQAVADFGGTGLEKVIVAVSDGIESCNGDPCATAADLTRQGFVIHTVGFLVDRPARLALQCIASVSGGRYFDVRDPFDLPDRLAQAFDPCPVAFVRPDDWETASSPAAG